MKKAIILAISVLVSVTSMKAQESTFNLNDKVVNLGIGLGSVYSFGLYNSTVIPPLSISFEKAIMDKILEKGVIGVGVYAGFTSYKWHYVTTFYDWGYNYTNIVLGARGTFHYPVLDDLDTYAGILLGANVVFSSEFGTSGGVTYDPDRPSIAYSGFLGARYYFSDKFSGFVELGYGISYLTLGLGIKL